MAAYLLAFYLAGFFGAAYGIVFPKSLGGGSLISVAATEWIRGISLGLIFLVTFGLSLSNGRNIWWWIGIAAAPAIIFEILLDPLHIYVPIILGLIAWQLGAMTNKALWKLVPGFMGKIG